MAIRSCFRMERLRAGNLVEILLSVFGSLLEKFSVFTVIGVFPSEEYSSRVRGASVLKRETGDILRLVWLSQYWLTAMIPESRIHNLLRILCLVLGKAFIVQIRKMGTESFTILSA